MNKETLLELATIVAMACRDIYKDKLRTNPLDLAELLYERLNLEEDVVNEIVNIVYNDKVR